GFDGGAEWGGAALDPKSQILYVNSNEIPWSLTMVDAPQDIMEGDGFKEIGRNVYDKNCMACHGTDLQGQQNAFPSLTGIGERYSFEDILKIVDQGKNRMPAFQNLSEPEKEAVVAFIMDLPEKES